MSPLTNRKAQGNVHKRRVQDRVREMLLSADSTASEEYFITSFLTEAMLTLHHKRREAELTNQELAAKLHTAPSVIARWEADLDGSISLEHYVRLAVACGVLPLDFTFVSLDDARRAALARLDAQQTD